MKFLFVSSPKIGSRIIRWALKARSSHFAICFDEDPFIENAIVFHSYGVAGTHLVWFEDFIANYKVEYALTLKGQTTLEQEESVYKKIIRESRAKGYDFWALAWWVWHGALERFFGKKIPLENGWQRDGYALCTQLAEAPIKALGIKIPIDFEATEPDELAELLIESSYFYDDRHWKMKANRLRLSL